MKKILTPANINMVILLSLLIVETVIMALFSPAQWYYIAACQFVGVLGSGLASYSYTVAFGRNKWRSRWLRENRDNIDETPSRLAVGIVKFSGYICLLTSAIGFLVLGILQ